MAKDSSFDVVSQIDMQEVDNAFGQAKKEMISATRKPTPPEACFLSVKTHSYCFLAFAVLDSQSGQGPDHFAMGGLGE